MSENNLRVYDRRRSVVFKKTKEAFGGLSNMASGFPIHIGELHIRSSEALYQACRFPNLPEVQRHIISQASPMTAKMVTKPHRKETRSDWCTVRVPIMKWCLRVKLIQNWDSFSSLLLATGSKDIVEESRRDSFWGCKSTDEFTLEGVNALGRLLMELRELIENNDSNYFQIISPPRIDNFYLLGKPIGIIYKKESSNNYLDGKEKTSEHDQFNLFDET